MKGESKAGNAEEKESKEEYLKRIYTTPGHPASFCGPEKLRQITKKEGLFKISRDDIRKFLEAQDVYTVNRHVRRRFARNKIIAHGVNDQYDMDLCDLSRLAKFNKNVTFLLVVVDVFSRFAFVRPLKNKSAESVLKALESIFKGDNLPRRIRSDRGKEFQNALARKFFESKGIKHYFASSPLKCQIVERLNQSLKQLIYRYLFDRNSYKYLDALGDIVEGYNRRPHRSLLGLSPAEVTVENQVKLWNEMYVNKRTDKRKSSVLTYKFDIGIFVRVSLEKKTFERAYNAKFSLEPFRVSARHMRNGLPVYMLKDMQGERLEGWYYESELQPMAEKASKDTWRVEKILRTRGKGANREVLVSWAGFPAKFNSWELKSSIVKNS